MKILALESSTSSAKAFLYDTERQSSCLKTKVYPSMNRDKSVHDAEKVFSSLLEVGREAAEGNPDIEMISLGGTWHSLCLFDQNMAPQTPVFPWCYTGASELCGKLRSDEKYVKEYYSRTGCMVNAIYPSYKLMMLRNEGYDLSRYRLGGQGVYNTYRLTGRVVATRCTASGTGLLNIRSKEYDPSVLAELGITDSVLPELVSYRQTYPLRKDMADYLGLREGVPVIPSNSDGGLNQIGVGALKNRVMTFSVGTSGALRLSTSSPILPECPSIWCYLSPKSWLSGAATSGACNCIEWFKHNFAGNNSYRDLETDFSEKADLPVFLPFLFGERCPGWRDDRRGEFAFLKPSHTIKEMYAAVQEGVLFNLYQCYEQLVKTGGEPTHIKFSGGILNSAVWTQMCADIFQRDLEVDSQMQSSLMGGIVLAMELGGVIEQAENFRSYPTCVVRPRKERGEVYQKRYRRYMECYENSVGQKGGRNDAGV